MKLGIGGKKCARRCASCGNGHCSSWRPVLGIYWYGGGGQLRGGLDFWFRRLWFRFMALR